MESPAEVEVVFDHTRILPAQEAPCILSKLFSVGIATLQVSTSAIDHFRNRALVLALALLLAPAAYIDAGWRPMFFLAHIGAVLIWQPVVPQRLRLTPLQISIVAIAGVLLSALLSAWTLLGWSILLTGLMAGRINMLAPRDERRFYLAAIGFLIILLFLLIVPALLPDHLRSGLPGAVAYTWLNRVLAISIIPLAFMAWRVDKASIGRQGAGRGLGAAYDLVYTAWVMGLLSLVIFCGIALMAVSLRGYLDSMAITLISVSAVLFAFSWLSAKFDDEGALGGRRSSLLPALVSRYLLSFGLPYEVWLDKLTSLNREEADPAQFFGEAMRALGALAIVSGAAWRGAGMSGEFGASEGGATARIVIQQQGRAAQGEIDVTLRTREALSPVFFWHFNLLIGLAAEFHWAKVREVQLVERNYLRAVHETGARLTHDVKNLLQSLNGLIDAIDYVDGEKEIRKLIGRQLPAIGQRLSATIAKLQAPSADTDRMVPVAAWWDAMCKRHEREQITFEFQVRNCQADIPESLFDSAAENMIRNAVRKRASQSGVKVIVRLVAENELITLRVEDSGAAIESGVAERLFLSPIDSRDGLGIGLYQLACQAQERGFEMKLESNQDSHVCFVLKGQGANQPL